MRGKKGFLRILEAFIAIILIAGVLVFLYTSQVQKPSQEAYVKQLQGIILDEITNDNVLRGYVLAGNKQKLNNFITDFMPPELDFDLAICDLNAACDNSPTKEVDKGKVVYVAERSVSSTLTDFNPKIIRLFIWEK